MRPSFAHIVLTSPDFAVPPVPPAPTGIAWLRASVGRFSSGPEHARRRGAQVAILNTIPLDALRNRTPAHPVDTLAHAMGVTEPIAGPVRDAAQAYQPGTGDESRADLAVDTLVSIFGGAHTEETAARIGLLVQACDATAALIERTRDRSVDVALRDDPPVPATKRQALVTTSIDGVPVEAGEVIRVPLSGELAFGTGPRRCPGQAHALALIPAPESLVPPGMS
jgi:hypothetical protein